MSIPMSPRGELLLRALRLNLELIAEHRKVAPHEADAMLQALATHLRSASPMTLLAAGGDA